MRCGCSIAVGRLRERVAGEKFWNAPAKTFWSPLLFRSAAPAVSNLSSTSLFTCSFAVGQHTMPRTRHEGYGGA
jgi:hypothetical protein